MKTKKIGGKDAWKLRHKVIALLDDGERWDQISYALNIQEKSVREIIKRLEPEMLSITPSRRFAVKVYKLHTLGASIDQIAPDLDISAKTALRAYCLGFSIMQRREKDKSAIRA